MNKLDSSKSPDKHDQGTGKLADRPAYLQRVFDSIPAQVDAIKAKKERQAKELRRFVRKLEEGE